MTLVKRDNVVDHLKACGWEADPAGHLRCVRYVRDPRTKELAPRQYRVKFGALACRIEVQAVQADGKTYWVRIGGAYYSAIRRPSVTVMLIGSYKFELGADKRMVPTAVRP